jgi:prephenate dehydratase
MIAEGNLIDAAAIAGKNAAARYGLEVLVDGVQVSISA